MTSAQWHARNAAFQRVMALDAALWRAIHRRNRSSIARARHRLERAEAEYLRTFSV
jgi:hypothetical protein